MKGLVIWAHSKCRSTFDLYREVLRQSPLPVKLVFRQGPLACRTAQGFPATDFDDVPSVTVGENRAAIDAILAETVGWTHVVAAYQVSPAFRRVMRLAHGRGDRVVVHSEAPCEMRLGLRGLLKRIYYRWILPFKTGPSVRCADLILNQSGTTGTDRLMRLGWRPERIVPFGYATCPLPDPAGESPAPARRGLRPFEVLHLGSEAPCRGVGVLERAVRIVRARGVDIVLRKTGGTLPLAELKRAIRGADVVVGCGLCEPWGMRVNDAIQEKRPVIVSDGMGVSHLVEQTGCGLIVPKGDAEALANALVRCATDPDLLRRLAAGAEAAARAWSPAARAKVFLSAVFGPDADDSCLKILHLCWGLEPTNGAAAVARMIAGEQRAAGHAVALASRPTWTQLRTADQVWCHCGWYWVFWLAALCRSVRAGTPSRWRTSASADGGGTPSLPRRRLLWMPHGCYDPVRLRYHGWKKLLAGPIERWALGRADGLVATCPAEAQWIRAYVGKGCPEIEVTDLRRFFDLNAAPSPMAPDRTGDAFRVLYLGRRHPLKGVEFLERAVSELNDSFRGKDQSSAVQPPTSNLQPPITLRIVSDHAGDELERDWSWCDVLCLPTLSENFGLVVAEALARGKRVLATDGAPAWDPSVTGTDYGGRLAYLHGYRAGTAERRVELLEEALGRLRADMV